MKKTILLITALIISSQNVLAHVAEEAEKGVTVAAFVGEHTFFLFGHTSPKAKVTLEGIGIFDQTYADKNGYFEFKNRYSPLSSREACLSSQDQFGRLSNPVCLPPFPVEYDATVGPVLLPPTLSLNKEYYLVGQDAVLSGQSIPNSEIDIALYTDPKNTFVNLLPQIVPSAQAFSFPELKTRSDSQGNFSIRLPSSNPEVYRIFGQVDFKNNPSAKSNTLSYRIAPWWTFIISLFRSLWSTIRLRLIELIILVEILLIAIYFLRRYLHPHPIASNKALALRPTKAIIEV